jgi:hypothetical protein
MTALQGPLESGAPNGQAARARVLRPPALPGAHRAVAEPERIERIPSAMSMWSIGRNAVWALARGVSRTPGTRSSTAGPSTTLGSQPSGRNAASPVASMPPDAPAAYGAAQKASHDQLYQAPGLSAVELEVLCLNQKHEQVHAAAGRQIRITAGPAKGGRLFWPATQTDSKRQAQAPLAQPR